MSINSLADSWAGDRAPDIIDLDRYMRGHVRPQHRREDSMDNLVVDAGGHITEPTIPLTSYKTNSSTSSMRRDKHYSHDSGLSDGSRTYVRRRNYHSVPRLSRGRRSRATVGAAASSDSLRRFRDVCEKALRDQQEQISRVAQLCERLTAVTAATVSPSGVPLANNSAPVSRRAFTHSQDSSDTSSSRSHSTRDHIKKDKSRTQECKTYKLIMTKLDELNRVLGSRARSSPPPRRPPPSVDSVSVCDKLVATHSPSNDVVAGYALTTTTYRPTLTSTPLSPHSHTSPQSTRALSREAGGTRRVARLEAVQTHPVDIAPAPARPPLAPRRSGQLNVAESILDYGYECDMDDPIIASSPVDQFDLNDPVQFYSQAKKMQQGLTATVTSNSPRGKSPKVAYETAHFSEKRENAPQSLCSICRSYWRSLSSMASQFFSRSGESN